MVDKLEIADMMAFAINMGYFCYGDSIEYLPRSDKFKVASSDLDKPVYYRLKGLVSEWFKVDLALRKDIEADYNDYWHSDNWRISYRIYDIQDKDYDDIDFLSRCIAHKEAHRLVKKGYKVELHKEIDIDCENARFEALRDYELLLQEKSRD